MVLTSRARGLSAGRRPGPRSSGEREAGDQRVLAYAISGPRRPALGDLLVPPHARPFETFCKGGGSPRDRDLSSKPHFHDRRARRARGWPDTKRFDARIGSRRNLTSTRLLHFLGASQGPAPSPIAAFVHDRPTSRRTLERASRKRGRPSRTPTVGSEKKISRHGPGPHPPRTARRRSPERAHARRRPAMHRAFPRRREPTGGDNPIPFLLPRCDATRPFDEQGGERYGWAASLIRVRRWSSSWCFSCRSKNTSGVLEDVGHLRRSVRCRVCRDSGDVHEAATMPLTVPYLAQWIDASELAKGGPCSGTLRVSPDSPRPRERRSLRFRRELHALRRTVRRASFRRHRRCPLHHACFSLPTGEAAQPPAIDSTRLLEVDKPASARRPASAPATESPQRTPSEGSVVGRSTASSALPLLGVCRYAPP